MIFTKTFSQTVCYEQKIRDIDSLFHIKMEPSESIHPKDNPFFAFSILFRADNNWKWILRRDYQSILSQRTIEFVFFVISVVEKITGIPKFLRISDAVQNFCTKSTGFAGKISFFCDS
jgi:hypothetical protein